MSDPRNYDPNIIMKAADDKLTNGDVNGGQMLFQSALLDWVDDARENISHQQDQDQMREAIATLWIAYTQFLRKAKQFKSATEAFEQAVECPVGGSVGRIWLEYARFLEDRQKLRTAQQVYLRALVLEGGGAVSDEQDRSLLWNEFLEMMRQSQSNESLTLSELRLAIEQEEAAKSNQVEGEASPEPVSSMTMAPADVDDNNDAPPPTKRARTTESAVQQDEPMEESRTHVVTPADIEDSKVALQDLTQNAQQDPDFLAAWMVRDGDAPPQPPEPPLFVAAPPKLSDPTGKDLLGEELALAMIQRLLEPSGSVLLEVCRALWTLTALNEQKSKKALERFDETVSKELVKLNARLDERLSVAGAAEAAVRQMNNTERQSFQVNCNQQRQHVMSGIAWDFRQLLWVQQQLLSKLNVPGFDGTTVEASALEFQARVCSYLHSAFYLRQRIGAQTHVTMLKSQAERLKMQAHQAPPKKKPSRFSAPRPPQYMPPPPPQQQQGYMQQQQQQQQQPPPGYYPPQQPQQQPMMYPPPPPMPHQSNYYQ
jgi:tetratricopeptide (TPR) repeat protein